MAPWPESGFGGVPVTSIDSRGRCSPGRCSETSPTPSVYRSKTWRNFKTRPTIRLRLLKIGARIRITARKVWISLATGYAWAGVFEQVYENLARGEPLRC